MCHHYAHFIYYTCAPQPGRGGGGPERNAFGPFYYPRCSVRKGRKGRAGGEDGASLILGRNASKLFPETARLGLKQTNLPL